MYLLENKYNDIKQDFIQLCNLNKQLKKQIEDIRRKNDKNKNYLLNLMETKIQLLLFEKHANFITNYRNPNKEKNF